MWLISEKAANDKELESIYPWIEVAGLPLYAGYMPGNLYSTRRGAGHDWSEGGKSLVLKSQNLAGDWALPSSDNYFAETPFTGDQAVGGVGEMTLACIAKVPGNASDPAVALIKNYDTNTGIMGMVYTPATPRLLLQSHNGTSLVTTFVPVPAEARDVYAFFACIFKAGAGVAYVQAPGGSLVASATLTTLSAPVGPNIFRLGDTSGAKITDTPIACAAFFRAAATPTQLAAVRTQMQAQLTAYGSPITI